MGKKEQEPNGVMELPATARHPQGKMLSEAESHAWQAWAAKHAKPTCGVYIHAPSASVYFVGQGNLDLGAVAVRVPTDQMIAVVSHCLSLVLGSGQPEQKT